MARPYLLPYSHVLLGMNNAQVRRQETGPPIIEIEYFKTDYVSLYWGRWSNMHGPKATRVINVDIYYILLSSTDNSNMYTAVWIYKYVLETRILLLFFGALCLLTDVHRIPLKFKSMACVCMCGCDIFLFMSGKQKCIPKLPPPPPPPQLLLGFSAKTWPKVEMLT